MQGLRSEMQRDIMALRMEMNERFNAMEQRFNSIDRKLDELLRLVADHDHRIAKLEGRS